ncbi:MAG: Smr/MutS family protein [Flavobacteriales bacterium]|nr:Smr/MutS family protein [Flavobacteriales bacterium]
MSAKMRIAVGDEVGFLDEQGGGTVLRLLVKDRVVVRTWDGFELEYPAGKLVPRAKSSAYTVSDHHAKLVAANDRMNERIDRDKGKGASVSNGGRAPKRVDDPSVMEIDLHLHKLIDNEEALSDGEKLSYQLDYFERMLNTAIRERKRRLVVIHGVGEGVLREEVRKALQYYEGCRFDDADPRRYGYGATAIEIVHY